MRKSSSGNSLGQISFYFHKIVKFSNFDQKCAFLAKKCRPVAVNLYSQVVRMSLLGECIILYHYMIYGPTWMGVCNMPRLFLYTHRPKIHLQWSPKHCFVTLSQLNTHLISVYEDIGTCAMHAHKTGAPSTFSLHPR